MSRKEDFIEKDLIFFAQHPDFIADELTIENQPCGNWRCRGNIDYHCVYNPRQFNVCGDKNSANDDFFKYD